MKRNLLTIMLAFFVVFAMSAQKNVISISANSSIKYHAIGKKVDHKVFTVSSKDVILSEDFEGGTMPTGWSQQGGASDWVISSDNSSGYWTIPAHTVYASINDDAAGSGADNSDTYIQTASMDFSSASAPKVNFEGISYGSSATFTLRASIDGGTVWTDITTYPSVNSWVAQETDLSSLAGEADVILRFHYNDGGSWGYGWAIDDIVVSEPSPHDLGITAVTPVIAQSGVEVTPQVTVHNYGTSDETTYSVELTNGSSYTSTISVTTTITSGSDAVIDMDAWTPAAGAYTLTATVTVADDANSANDVFVLNGNAAAGEWKTSTATMGSPMYLGSGAYNTDDNMLYSIGGNDATAIISIYDVVNDSWSTGAALPGSMNIGSAAYGNGIVYVHAGDDGTKAYTGRFWAYDVAGDSWSTLADVPASIGWTTLVYSATQNAVYLLGGHDGTDAVSSVYVYDITSDAWVSATSLPVGVFGTVSVIQDDVIYVIGGIEADFTTTVNKGVIDGSDPSVIVWTTVADYPIGVYKHEAAPYGDGRIIVTGGAGAGGYWTSLGNTYIYDIAEDTWEQVGDKTTPVLGGAEGTFLIDNELRFCVASGYDGSATINHVDYYAEPYGVSVPTINTDITGVSVYPNPSNGQFTINVENDFNLEVFDITGKIITTRTLTGNTTLELNTAGVYFLRFSNEEGSVTQRVIVQ